MSRGAFEDRFADDLQKQPWLPFQVLLAEVCAAFQDNRHAAALYDWLLPYAGQVPSPPPPTCVCQGSVSRYLGLLATTLGRWDDAVAHFADALAMHERMGARPLLAHTRREYAAMLLCRRGRGDLASARDLLERAVNLYREMGMDSWAAKAQALLDEPGLIVVPPSAPAYPDGLSEREVEVLRLVAAGRSNPQIAEALFISINTVTRHVTHIFEKTGSANRAEAAAYALRHGLVD